MEGVDYNSSSSDKENVKPRTKRILEDALFEFSSKEAVRSVKRDFSDFCKDFDVWAKICITRSAATFIGNTMLILFPGIKVPY